MDRVVRFLAIVLLAVFAVGTVAHAANVTNMSFAMSTVVTAEGDVGNCDGCPPADDCKAKPCVLACLTPLVAIPAAAEFEFPLLLSADVPTLPLEEIVGQTGPPDLPPPRTIVL